MKHCDVHNNCEHKKVKFCASCRDIYCVACKKTWEEPCTQSHNIWFHNNWPNYYQPYTFTGQAHTTTGYVGIRNPDLSGVFSSTDIVADDGHKVTCTNHV